MPPKLDDIKDLIRPAMAREDFRVFVFGPYLLPADVVEAPAGLAETHEEVISHSKYLRYLSLIHI